MLAYAFRRVLWAVPTLFGISLVVFLVTALVPDPIESVVAMAASAGDGAAGALAGARLGNAAAEDAHEEARRARFLDLPPFVNPQPRDVRSRAEEAVAHLQAHDARAAEAERTLGRLGGAALPFVLPDLDNLAPDVRGRVAVALGPVALRMGETREALLQNPEQATLYWTRFWGDHSLDFTGPVVARAVRRLTLRTTVARERDLEGVDTFALPELMTALRDTGSLDVARALTALAAHCTGRPTGFPDEDAPLDATGNAVGEEALTAAGAPPDLERIKASWDTWWRTHESDFRPYDGVERVAATLLQTRYGKWVTLAAEGKLGVSTRDGMPVLEKLRARAPVTLLLTVLALLVSYAVAIPLGLVSAVWRGGPLDMALAVVLFVLYSFPTFWAAELLVHAFALAGSGNPARAPLPWQSARDAGRLVAPVATLALGSLATLSRFQRASLLDVIRQDYIRTARAKGARGARVLVVHALRNALLPTVTLAGLQFPALLGGAFVVEEVFGVPGLGYETLRAVEAHDAPWLVATVLLTALATTVALLASDLAYGLLDPRVREGLSRRGRVA